MATRRLKSMRTKWSINYSQWLIIAILLVAAILRLWKLGNIPPHLTSDEASLGYNAYSILKTGRDEYGKFMPMIFKSFGDYKPGLYVYTAVPFVAALGLNEFAVRLPSAVAGIFAIWLVYLLTNELFKSREFEIWNLKFGIWPTFLLAMSPWHIQFSRGAWEANLALTLTLAGILFFLKCFKNSKYLLLSAAFFASTLLTYQGAKLSTSIVLAILVAVYWKDVRGLLKDKTILVVTSTLTGLVIALPILLSLFQGQTGRLNVFSVFSYPRSPESVQQLLNEGYETKGSLSYYLFHSESLNFVRAISGRWFNHFSGRFLFFEGDYQNLRHSAPNQGMLLLFDLILLPLGLYQMFKKQLSSGKKFILLWLVLASLPAALSRDEVHAIRALNMVIPLTVISSFGLYLLLKKLVEVKNNAVKYLTFCFSVFLFLSSFVYYLDAYFIHLPKHDSAYWEYGYKQIVESVTPLQSKYAKIKVQQSFAQPYIFFLFYQHYDPAKYQKLANLTESEYRGDVGYVTKLDNVYFSAIDWPQDKKEHGTIVVADPIRIPEEEVESDSIHLIKEIDYLNGVPAFYVVEVL
jgi:4-amino-4-deoxy-L-arabinose transferase-like glycosyltransferase